MTHVDDKVMVLPDGSGGYILRATGDPQVGDKVMLLPSGGNQPIVVVSNESYTGSKAVVTNSGSRPVVIMAEGGPGDTEPGPDGEPPGSFHMLSHVPPKNATGVDRVATMVATFNDDVYPPTVLEHSGPYNEDQVVLLDSYGSPVAGFPGASGKVVTFDPVSDLTYGETYTMIYKHYIRNTDQVLLYKQYNIPFTVASEALIDDWTGWTYTRYQHAEISDLFYVELPTPSHYSGPPPGYSGRIKFMGWSKSSGALLSGVWANAEKHFAGTPYRGVRFWFYLSPVSDHLTYAEQWARLYFNDTLMIELVDVGGAYHENTWYYVDVDFGGTYNDFTLRFERESNDTQNEDFHLAVSALEFYT